MPRTQSTDQFGPNYYNPRPATLELLLARIQRWDGEIRSIAPVYYDANENTVDEYEPILAYVAVMFANRAAGGQVKRATDSRMDTGNHVETAQVIRTQTAAVY